MTAFYKVTGVSSWTSIPSPTLNSGLGDIYFTIVPTAGDTAIIWIELELTGIYANTQKNYRQVLM